MGLVTEKITYNVKERGRKFRGIDRDLDTASLARVVNSGSTQERVKHGDMVGYYGHWPRVKFGLAPVEAGLIDGVMVPIPVALRMVHLSADADGWLTHQVEFADTNEGRIAEALYSSKMGGFSTAIEPVPNTSPIAVREFWGADFVNEPNYTTNRGHKVLLDSINSGLSEESREEFMALLDSVMHEQTAGSAHLLALLDAMGSNLKQALEYGDRMARDVDLLVGRLAAGGGGVLDDILGEGVQQVQGRRVPDFARFADRPLVPLQTLPQEKAPAPDGVMTRYGLS